MDGPGPSNQVRFMKPVPIYEAKARLSQLIERAPAGEELVIAKSRKPVIRLVAVDRPEPRRQFGAMKGLVWVDDSFFDPLADDELGAWGGTGGDRAPGHPRIPVLARRGRSPAGESPPQPPIASTSGIGRMKSCATTKL
jgi:prevent-host-death family protein